MPMLSTHSADAITWATATLSNLTTPGTEKFQGFKKSFADRHDIDERSGLTIGFSDLIP